MTTLDGLEPGRELEPELEFELDNNGVKSRKKDDSDSQSAGNCIDGPKIDRKIDENDDGMLLERITRGPGQGGPRRSSVFLYEK